MVYFKVVQGDTVVDAGFVFLRWNSKHNRLYICDIQDAEFAQSYNETTIYHDSWLKTSEYEDSAIVSASITIVEESEYDEIVALLDNGETIVEPEEESEEETDNSTDESDDDFETPMTISEMRSTILEQQEQINMLTSCLLEMSEIVYA